MLNLCSGIHSSVLIACFNFSGRGPNKSVDSFFAGRGKKGTDFDMFVAGRGK